MDVNFAVAFCFLFFVGFPLEVSSLSSDSEPRRYYIYWDRKVTESIRNPDYNLVVDIGNFMDIVCPFKMAGDPNPPLFDLYNVTEKGFKNCDPTEGKLIFACNRPDQENKLTIKFQRISPSPFGFRFRECEDYYFIASKRTSQVGATKRRQKYQCTKESERLRISVRCPRDETSTTTTTKSTTTTTTTLKTPQQPVVPEISPVTPDNKHDDQNKAVHLPSHRKGPGDNGSSRTVNFSSFTVLFCVLISTMSVFIHRSSS